MRPIKDPGGRGIYCVPVCGASASHMTHLLPTADKATSTPINSGLCDNKCMNDTLNEHPICQLLFLVKTLVKKCNTCNTYNTFMHPLFPATTPHDKWSP